MICTSCLRRASSAARRPLNTPVRLLSTTPLQRSAAAGTTFSTPTGPAPTADAPKTPSIPASSCPAGTVMVGLNYVKGKEDPVALADEEYPAWLWTCLRDTRGLDAKAEEEVPGEFSKSKKERRLAAKKKRNEEKRIIESGDLSAIEPKIPMTHQTINLPSNEDNTVDGAVEAMRAREDLRRAMRRDRKAKIKDNNYLKTMK